MRWGVRASGCKQYVSSELGWEGPSAGVRGIFGSRQSASAPLAGGATTVDGSSLAAGLAESKSHGGGSSGMQPLGGSQR